MVKVLEVKNLKLENQLDQALSLLARFEQHGDTERVNKAKNLLRKIHTGEFIAAFSGHFSAGKSTMINALIGDSVLPSSPIPTSANLVKVHHSVEEYAKVYYETESPLLFREPYDFETVKEFCKREDVLEIEIGRKNSKLPHGVTVMDTPGVDSTDDAHRISTESALHLADIVFYVMDYNHVQSELNFLYTKNLLAHGVHLYLIINQIDKHDDKELSFNDFKKSVHESFAAWDVHPAGIFFTTLKDPDHKENEFSTVKYLIDDALSHQADWIEKTIQSAFKLMINEHCDWLLQKKIEAGQTYSEQLSQYTEDELAQFITEEENLVHTIEGLSDRIQDWTSNYETEREKILKNAYLMPFETRELAERFLESAQADFKAGFFFSRKRTEEVRKERLEAFSNSLRKQTEAQLNWHLRELTAQQLADAGIFQDELQQSVQKIKVDFDDQFLFDCMKKGARVTGDYVLNYCEDVANGLKRIAKWETDGIKEKIVKNLQLQMSRELDQKNERLSNIRKITNALRKLEVLEDIYEEEKNSLSTPAGNEQELLNELQTIWAENESNVRVFTGSHEAKIEDVDEEPADNYVTEGKSQENHEIVDPGQVASQLEKAIEHLTQEPAFQRIVTQLELKTNRLKERNYTIALFGAFSAGKSSFSNAMLQASVLPVSPNPTTAAINRICPPTAAHKHGTAVVSMKDEQQMLDDVLHSLRIFGHHCSSLDEAYTAIPSIRSKQNGEAQDKVHLAFLHAFTQGYEQYKHYLGEKITTNINEFQGFVANESQSCFVESIDLYFDCPLTRKGITLVDTPGADSINARHTDVAFDYIRNSDAILFVTYYNHAFSKADREFLIQLGRVKDAFELDKMFFIVNAIDLASSKEEVNEVLSYVNGQLLEYGIRFPRIFGISSKLAQDVETRQESNIEEFNAAFNEFLDHELTYMAVQSAQAEYDRAVAMLEQMIATANEDKEEKEKRKQKMAETRAEINERLTSANTGALEDRLLQEAQELIHYVKQRVFYRFAEFFKESFNPASLQKNSRELLEKALEELLGAMGYDFAQEMRATSLRVERFIEKLLQERFELLANELQGMQEDLTFSNFEIGEMNMIEFLPAFDGVDRKPLHHTFKYFRNPRAFFENNERKQMEEALMNELSPLADDYLEDSFGKMAERYTKHLEDEFTLMINGMKDDIEEQYSAWLLAYDDYGRIEQWQHIRKALHSIIK